VLDAQYQIKCMNVEESNNSAEKIIVKSFMSLRS